MFKCEISKKISKPGEKPVKLVTQTREVIYYKKVKNSEGQLVVAFDKTGNPVVQGQGWEIVQEKLVLQSVAEKMRKQDE